MEGLAPLTPLNLGRIIAVFNWVQYSFCRGTILSCLYGVYMQLVSLAYHLVKCLALIDEERF